MNFDNFFETLSNMCFRDDNPVNRIELIGTGGHIFVHQLSEGEVVSFSYQDDGQTLKIFIGESDE